MTYVPRRYCRYFGAAVDTAAFRRSAWGCWSGAFVLHDRIRQSGNMVRRMASMSIVCNVIITWGAATLLSALCWLPVVSGDCHRRRPRFSGGSVLLPGRSASGYQAGSIAFAAMAMTDCR